VKDNKAPRGIVVSSQKGGVGKTTIAVNLAAALNAAGYSVLLIDGDYANPSVGFHLGLENANIGLRAVLGGKASLQAATVVHNPTGLRVLPSEIRGEGLSAGHGQVRKLYRQLLASGYDYVILDMAPGPLPQQLLNVFRQWHGIEILLVLTPEMSACMSAVRLANIYDRLHIERRFVANKVTGRRYELRAQEMESAVGDRLLAELPEDEDVPISIANHIPAYVFYPRSPFTKSMRMLSMHYATGKEVEPIERPIRPGFLAFILRLLGIR
jgi:MinD-like ATPase involved in chromosome partitioning or flagellar assembly